MHYVSGTNHAEITLNVHSVLVHNYQNTAKTWRMPIAEQHQIAFFYSSVFSGLTNNHPLQCLVRTSETVNIICIVFY